MDLRQKQKILSDILRLAKKEYRKKKEEVESAVGLEKAENVLWKLNNE